MQADIQADNDIILTAVDLLKQHVDWPTLEDRLAALEAQVTDAGFWDDQANAQKIMQQKNHLENQFQTIRQLEDGLAEQLEMIALADAENDEEVREEAKSALAELRQIAQDYLRELKKDWKKALHYLKHNVQLKISILVLIH